MKKLRSKQDVVKLIEDNGFLPFFKGEIKNFSISELIDSRFWFPDEGEGIWEWKGPIIQHGGIAYGKFYRKKALFISMEFFPDFLNYRRSKCVLTENEKDLLELLREEGSLVSKEWKILAGYEVSRKRRNLFTGIIEKDEPSFCVDLEKRESFDRSVTALQMSCYVITEDFEYSIDSQGRPYGWGLARYTTPEIFFGNESFEISHTPEQSFDLLFRHLKKLLPKATEREILNLLG